MQVDAGVPITELGEAPRHRGEREVAWIAGIELVPHQGRRDARVRRRPHRVGARHRTILRVLVVVKEHTLALLLPPLAGRQAGCTPLDLARESERGPPYLTERPRALDAHADVYPARARRLGPADQREIGEGCVHDAGDVAQLGPGDAGHRIEVDA